jgi:hypothetical protein
VRFFFDNCVSPRIAEALQVLEKDAGNVIEHLRVRFPGRTLDPDWIRTLGEERDWIICSTDLKIRRNPDNRRAWQEAKLRTFFFSQNCAESKIWPQVQETFRWWPEIKLLAKQTEGEPAAYKLPWRQNKAVFLERI